MTENDYGKTCETCDDKKNQNCEGCKVEPGHQSFGDCELAHRAQLLGKWLWLLFWLVIPTTLSGIMTDENVVKILPTLYLPGQILSAFCSFAYGIILLKLSSENEGYHKAGTCYLVAASVAVVVFLLTVGNSEVTGIFLLTLPAGIVQIVGYYREVNAHADVLNGVDNVLSEKWRILWKWYIGMLGAVVGSIIVMLISPILGLLVVFIGIIGSFVVSIIKLVYLYRTAKLLREYPIEQV